MIPVKLALRNFMPYRGNVPPLDFVGIHTATICGDNGSGKSALLDAITWALWGKTRAKSDDDLIHQGETETVVEFDFAVGQQIYRVIRKHSKPKRRRASGQTDLQFQMTTAKGFQPITGNGVQETQRKIIDVLHMDYETFKNSALLRQGHADEFTVANPAKRKQVLADILGLSLYDQLEEKAKELAKEQEGEKALAESAIKDIVEQLAQKPTYEMELKQAQDELSSIERVLAGQESRVNELRQKREVLKNKQWQLTQLEQHIAETARALEHWDDQIRQHLSRIKEYEELIARRSPIEAGYSQLVEARKLNEELNQKLRLLSVLNERKHQLEMAIIQSSQALLREHALVENKIVELEASSQKLPQLRQDLQLVLAKLHQLAVEEEALNRKGQTSQELRTHVHYLESNNARLEQEIKEIEEKLALLLSEGGARCPLCETELGEEGIRLIEAKYSAEKRHKTNSLKLSQAELAQKIRELDLLENEISRLEARLNEERSAAQGKAGLLSREIGDVEKAISQLAEERKRLLRVEERLARKDFATQEQEALGQIEGELAELDYNAQQHEQVRQRLSSLEQYENPRRKLEEADRLISQEKEALSRAEQASQEMRQSLETERQKRQELIVELGSLPTLDDELAQAESERQGLSAEQKEAQERVGSIKEKLQRCSELETMKREKEKQLSQTTKETGLYQELAEAFGKKGIPAWLIERALPEIEAEANKLLSRMTDNRMHVKMETQRETKKGEVAETLDITISDELGTRSYEMFSGGETFRINFAIRIALSKLLAKRAGAPLPTLIIDEGFGTQDSSGLEKLKEAITSIQDDFDKILIVTHIEDFKDAFPARIEVVKTAEGSTIEVS